MTCWRAAHSELCAALCALVLVCVRLDNTEERQQPILVHCIWILDTVHTLHITVHTYRYMIHIAPCCIWLHDTAHYLRISVTGYMIQRAHCALQSTQPQWIINWSLSPPRLTSYHYVWQARVTAHVTEYSKLQKTQNCSKNFSKLKITSQTYNCSFN